MKNFLSPGLLDSFLDRTKLSQVGFLILRQTARRWEKPGGRSGSAQAIWSCCACPIARNCSTSSLES